MSAQAEGSARPEADDGELERARLAYLGAMESARAWRRFSDNPRHHDVTFWTILTALFVEPGMNRMSLIDKIIDFAAVSRSTAERAVREARGQGFIVDRPAGKEVRHYLSDACFEHCLGFFREYMDMAKLLRNLGYDRPA